MRNIFFIFCLLSSCTFTSDEDYQAKRSPQVLLKQGEALAKKYCASCHSFPSPELLDKFNWKSSILPYMAPKLGIAVFGHDDYINNPHIKSAVTYQQWMKIVNYYLVLAPDSLRQTNKRDSIRHSWSLFSLREPSHPMNSGAKTMLVNFDIARHDIYTSDGNTGVLYRWNKNLKLTDSVMLPSPAVSIDYNLKPGSRHASLTLIGTMIAEESTEGRVVTLDLNNMHGPVDTLAKNLSRPVQAVAADFDKDGLEDYVVCGFGHNKGALVWIKQNAAHQFQQKIIAGIPGAIQVVVQDFNKDGWPDMMVLFAHADESLKLYLNDHNGSFSEKRLLSFPPVYGTSSFQLADMNNDGLDDIVYTCGDNGDNSGILKPYHGVYIFTNQGNYSFSQSYFYPVNGCSKAVVADFDRDGKPDMATIAFFADFKNNPAEKFIYFRQDTPMHFIPYSPPIEKNGRWLTMDAKDYDGDGDIDIILGNYARGLMITKNYRPNWDNRTPFIVLENETIK